MAWISSSPQPCDSGCSTCGSRSITDHDESCTSTLPRAQLPAESSSNCARPSPAVLAKEIRPERALTSRAQQDRPSAQPARDRRRALEIYVEQLADLLEKQTQNVASIAPFGELVKLQMEHDAWKLERDLRCADTKRRALATNEKPLRATARRGSRMLEHETGLAGGLRPLALAERSSAANRRPHVGEVFRPLDLAAFSRETTAGSRIGHACVAAMLRRGYAPLGPRRAIRATRTGRHR